MKRLIEIQKELKAPKGQYNSFGKYKYRNCEDILEAVKPLLEARNLFITLNDDIVSVNERYYVKATATIFDSEGKEIAHTSAFAREEENKKGMDGSQVTGASSSYARKYALNGLFAIDDTKDSDTTNKGEIKPEPQEEPIDNDIDLIEGLKACDTIANLIQYKSLHLHQVSDKAKFLKVFAEVTNQIKKTA